MDGEDKIDGADKREWGKARKGELIRTPWQTDENENNQGVASNKTCVPFLIPSADLPIINPYACQCYKKGGRW